MNKTTNFLLGAILLIGIVSLIASLRPKIEPNITVIPPEVNVQPVLGGENEYYDGVTHTSISISATAIGTAASGTITQALAANSGRQYARIQNVGGNLVSCQLDEATSTLVSGTGIALFPSSSTDSGVFEITPDNLYKGIVRCIAQTSTGTISIVEK